MSDGDNFIAANPLTFIDSGENLLAQQQGPAGPSVNIARTNVRTTNAPAGPPTNFLAWGRSLGAVAAGAWNVRFTESVSGGDSFTFSSGTLYLCDGYLNVSTNSATGSAPACSYQIRANVDFTIDGNSTYISIEAEAGVSYRLIVAANVVIGQLHVRGTNAHQVTLELQAGSSVGTFYAAEAVSVTFEGTYSPGNCPAASDVRNNPCGVRAETAGAITLRNFVANDANGVSIANFYSSGTEAITIDNVVFAGKSFMAQSTADVSCTASALTLSGFTDNGIAGSFWNDVSFGMASLTAGRTTTLNNCNATGPSRGYVGYKNSQNFQNGNVLVIGSTLEFGFNTRLTALQPGSVTVRRSTVRFSDNSNQELTIGHKRPYGSQLPGDVIIENSTVERQGNSAGPLQVWFAENARITNSQLTGNGPIEVLLVTPP